MNGFGSPQTQIQEVTSVPAGDILSQWTQLATAQEALVKNLLDENNRFKEELDIVKDDNSMMRMVVRSLRDELLREKSLTSKLEARVAALAQTTSHLETQRNMVLTLIDGDGYIFNNDMLRNGEDGGREAATSLTTGITRYLSGQPNTPTNARLWTIIFMSKERLEGVLAKASSCSPEQFKLFVKGFSQASPLFSICEVGASKEAADHKIREHLNQFIGNPHIYKVILGVDHDNGYGAALSASLTSGNGHRLVLLKAHKMVVPEIHRLNLDTVSIDGLFSDEKLSIVPPPQRQNGSYARITAASPASSSSINATSPTPSSAKAYTPPGKRERETTLPKRDPPACNLWYLRNVCDNSSCLYGHNYELSDAELRLLAEGAKQQPCKHANEGNDCWLKNCIYGHKCPRGCECFYRAQGRCRFIGKGMHDP